jgi:CDP-diglyceride synthetase
MHRKLKGESRRRHTSFGEYVLLILIGVFAFMTAGELHNRGIPHKWATAIMGTLVTFGIVIYLCRRMWNRWAFWAAISICLAAHTIVTWVFFQYVLYGANRFSILFWYPVMLVEVFALFNCSEENSGQIDWHTRNNQIELLNPLTTCLTCRAGATT